MVTLREKAPLAYNAAPRSARRLGHVAVKVTSTPDHGRTLTTDNALAGWAYRSCTQCAAFLQHMQLRHGKGVAIYVVWSDWSPASTCHASCVDTRYFTQLSVVHTGRMHYARFRLLQMEFGELLMLLCTSALLRLKAALVFGGCPASA